jgi:4-amino-4-deoxychorismate lyase
MTERYQFVEEQSIVNSDDRGFQYGDGLFETIAIRQHEPRLWNYHFRRLESGCKRLALELPAAAALRHRLCTAVAESAHDSDFCVAKIIVTAGVSRRGYGREMPTDSSIYMGVFPANPVIRQTYEKGAATILCKTRLAVGSPVAGLKTLNRIEQVLARSECLRTGAFEGLTLDTEGRLICGTMSNVFIARDKKIATPALDRCGVAGIMRQFILELLEQQGTDVEVRDLEWDDLIAADEVFITNSQMGLVPVHRCENQEWKIGGVTHDVMKLLAANGIAECRV